MIWTPEDIQVLSALAAEGRSAAQIAREMTGKAQLVSRNAVIGKMNRLGIVGLSPGNGLPRVALPPIRPVSRIGKGVRLRSQKQARLVERKDAGTNGSQWITLAKLRAGLCRFPKGDPRDLETFRYCGAAVEPDRPYCPFHCSIAYETPAQRRQQRMTAHG